MNSRKDLLMMKIDDHLRKMARQLVKFDTLNETLDYLTESFWNKFFCDYVAIILKEGNLLKIKFEKGESKVLAQQFPLEGQDFSPLFLTKGVAHLTEIPEDQQCRFEQYLKAEGFSNWLTVPIKESDFDSLGICVIGYRKSVPFVVEKSVENLFLEFGKDIATSIGVAINRDNEKKKVIGIDWLKENIYLGSSIDQLIKKIVERAGHETNADSAYVYLYDEVLNEFVYHPPSYGVFGSTAKIKIHDDYNLFHHFRFLEKEGGNELTIPLMVNLKTIGVLHVAKTTDIFTREDKERLQFLSSYVSVLIENARLYKSELEAKSRLEKIVIQNQELVQQTATREDFAELVNTISRMIHSTVILYDRFFRPITYSMTADSNDIEQISAVLNDKKWEIMKDANQEQWIRLNDVLGEYGIWKVIGGKDLHGYLAINLDKQEIDVFIRMELNQALNVCAIQFIKQKLVADAKEQIKDSLFINQLLVEKIEDKSKIAQYSSLFNFNIHESHKIGLMSIEFNGKFYDEHDLFAQEITKNWLWERIREKLSQFDPDILLTRKDSYYVLFASEKKERENKNYWESIYHLIKKFVSNERPGGDIFLGISKSTESMDDYFTCYKQALQALNIVSLRHKNKGFLSFNGLGSYAVLHNLHDHDTGRLFIREYLDPLMASGNDKTRDLFDTLHVYLQVNGNMKDTAGCLHIHVNTLKYRLGKIKELLNLDIDDAEVRFNLMLAYKLYDLYHLSN
ncbi:helix-turn-helix domain-containing protein [Paenibacillaceae bacterium T2]|uniref:Helix-turn-helix domain-containing protein n=2 Tax=Ferviditalea candida TaxID=3108399 RepID=A0ABU5ZQQ1_9BACL|nr:helix-turn-helix domain-containing protein [Paenibacillaceae bacterium T2]